MLKRTFSSVGVLALLVQRVKLDVSLAARVARRSARER